ncbi:MAG TPA: hypothetical protein DD412_01575 [Holosporales bacterium]|nr:hypothetical protein [Holosporales bacterium]
MSTTQSVIELFERKRDGLKTIIELFENGTMHQGKREGGGPWVDTTAQSLADAKEDLAEIERILAEAKK